MHYQLDIMAIDGPVFSGSFKSIYPMAEKIVHHLGSMFEVGSGYAVSSDGVCTAMISGCTWTDICEAVRDMESQEESNNARASYEYWGRAIGDIDADGEPAF